MAAQQPLAARWRREAGACKVYRVLTDFVAHNFRTFDRLELPRLGRVNLIVGKNNVGKSSLLDALRLYLSNADAAVIRELLDERDETVVSLDGEEPRLRLEALFHGWVSTGSKDDIRLGPSGSADNQVVIQSRALRRRSPRAAFGEEDKPSYVIVEPGLDDDPQFVPGLRILAAGVSRMFPSDYFSLDRKWWGRGSGLPRPMYVSSRGMSLADVARCWDFVSLRDSEQRVIDCLQMIAPVERITLVERTLRTGTRVPWVRVQGKPFPMPLKSMGDGMSRIFQFGLAMELAAMNEKSGRADQPELPGLAGTQRLGSATILIDEIENGIHYSALPDLWRFIFNSAKRSNVQVFATSHSLDCIKAFSVASREDNGSEGVLIRLEQQGEDIVPVTIDEQDLFWLTENELEMR